MAKKAMKNRLRSLLGGGGSLFLVSLSTVAVGYANWDVGPKIVSLLPSTDIGADEAIDARIFGKPSVATFKTAQDGIFDRDDSSALILTGYITVNFSINASFLLTYGEEYGYLSSGSFSFLTSLIPDDSSFLAYIDTSISMSLDGGEAASNEGERSSTALMNTLSVSLSNDSSITVKLIYTVKEPSRGYIYSTYKDMSLSFLVSAKKVATA